MKSHVDGVRTLLAPLGYAVYFVAAPATPTYPYVILRTSLGDLVRDVLDGTTTLSDTLYVTTVHTTPDGALVAGQKVRDRLDGAAPVAAGWHVHELRLVDSQAVELDRDVALTGGSYPAYVVDLYDYDAERV